jgi:coenzyme Q-binding protein COQ10
MRESKQEIELNYKAVDLFNIVLDIEKYPQYIPWCTYAEILSKKNNEIKANMVVEYKFFPSQKFTSNVVFDLEKMLIKTNYVEGPLKDLTTIWEFKNLKKNKSKISFKVKFEFKNFFHQKIAELFFPLVESQMIKSFIERANQTLQ